MIAVHGDTTLSSMLTSFSPRQGTGACKTTYFGDKCIRDDTVNTARLRTCGNEGGSAGADDSACQKSVSVRPMKPSSCMLGMRSNGSMASSTQSLNHWSRSTPPSGTHFVSTRSCWRKDVVQSPYRTGSNPSQCTIAQACRKQSSSDKAGMTWPNLAPHHISFGCFRPCPPAFPAGRLLPLLPTSAPVP